jgi:hypothetical protein
MKKAGNNEKSRQFKQTSLTLFMQRKKITYGIIETPVSSIAKI